MTEPNLEAFRGLTQEDAQAAHQIMMANPGKDPLWAVTVLRDVRRGQVQQLDMPDVVPEAPPAPQTMSEKVAGGLQNVRDRFASGLTRWSGLPEDVTGPVSNFVIPGSAGQLAGDAALLGLSLFPPTAGFGIPALATRVGSRTARIVGPALAAATTEGVLGGNPVAAGSETLIANTVGETVAPVAKFLASPITGKFRSGKDAKLLGTALYREVPEFGERRTPDELWQLVHGGQGRKILSDTMERAEANLVNSTPVGTMVTVPALNQHFGRPPTTNAFGFQTHAQIPMTQALDELKKLRATAHNTMLREQTAGSLGYDVRDLSREALDEFSSALNYLNLPADVISHWHGARSTYSRGSAIMDYLSDSQVFQGTGGMSPRLKMEGAQRTLGKDVQTGSYTQGSYYEDLLKRGVNPEFMREGILRGANPGAVDVNLPIGSSRGYHERGSVSLPLHGLLEFQRTIGRPAKVGPFNNAYPTLVDIISGAGASLLNLKQVFTP